MKILQSLLEVTTHKQKLEPESGSTIVHNYTCSTPNLPFWPHFLF